MLKKIALQHVMQYTYLVVENILLSGGIVACGTILTMPDGIRIDSDGWHDALWIPVIGVGDDEWRVQHRTILLLCLGLAFVGRFSQIVFDQAYCRRVSRHQLTARHFENCLITPVALAMLCAADYARTWTLLLVVAATQCLLAADSMPWPATVLLACLNTCLVRSVPSALLTIAAPVLVRAGTHNPCVRERYHVYAFFVLTFLNMYHVALRGNDRLRLARA